MKSFLPMALRTERAASSVAASPPIMKTSSPFSAHQVPPVTGASEEANSGGGRGSGDFSGEGGRDSAGVNVDSALFERREGGFVALFQRTSSRAGGVADDCEKYVGAAATSCGEAARFAPAATRESAREAVRFQTTRGKPALRRLLAHGKTHEAQTD